MITDKKKSKELKHTFTSNPTLNGEIKQRNKPIKLSRKLTEMLLEGRFKFLKPPKDDLGPYAMQFTVDPDVIMTKMSKDLLKIFKLFWDNYEDGLTLTQLIELMVNELGTSNEEQTYELIYGIYQLFQEVDINGDGNLEWSEFMQYIVD
jgi:hypothetical protein